MKLKTIFFAAWILATVFIQGCSSGTKDKIDSLRSDFAGEWNIAHIGLVETNRDVDLSVIRQNLTEYYFVFKDDNTCSTNMFVNSGEEGTWSVKIPGTGDPTLNMELTRTGTHSFTITKELNAGQITIEGLVGDFTAMLRLEIADDSEVDDTKTETNDYEDVGADI